MRKTAMALCLLTLMTSCSKPAISESTELNDDIEWFKQKYLEEEKVLYEQYVVNKKWNVRHLSGFIPFGETACITSRDSSRSVRQFDNIKLQYINSRSEHQFIKTEAGILTIHENYTSDLDRQPELAPYYAIHSFIEVPNIYPLTVFSSNLMPTMLGTAFRRSSLGDYGVEDSLRIKNIDETTFESHNAIAVETWSKTTYYFDLENHLAFLGYVESGSYSGGIFEYVKSDQFPYPVPKSFYKWRFSFDDKGQVVKSKSIDFEVLEFSNYTPTADDFDVEKQTGLKPIPPTEIEVPKKPKRDDTQKAVKPTDPQERWVYIIAIGSVLLIIACIVAFQMAQMRARRTTTRQTTK